MRDKFTSHESVEHKNESLQPLFRGIWSNKLENNIELPVGGSIFNDEVTTKLLLDFDHFDAHLKNVSKEEIDRLYEENKQRVITWLEQVGSTVDPYTYFVCFQVQQLVHRLLEVPTETQTNTRDRADIYRDNKSPTLSSLKGKTACAERAAFGQYLLQKAGVDSAYMGGIAMQDIFDEEEFPEDHSFLVLKHPTNSESALIFDIARPRSGTTMPRILETDSAFTYDTLKGKRDCLIGATEVLQGGRLWFGVGQPVAKKRV